MGDLLWNNPTDIIGREVQWDGHSGVVMGYIKAGEDIRTHLGRDVHVCAGGERIDRPLKGRIVSFDARYLVRTYDGHWYAPRKTHLLKEVQHG